MVVPSNNSGYTMLQYLVMQTKKFVFITRAENIMLLIFLKENIHNFQYLVRNAIQVTAFDHKGPTHCDFDLAKL